jgi:alpha-amylase
VGTAQTTGNLTLAIKATAITENVLKIRTPLTETSAVAGNVLKIRTPLTKIYLKVGKAIKAPVAFDGKESNGKEITAAKLTWKSSNTKIATVGATGKIMPKKAGKAVITATALNGKKLKITVYVVKKSKALKKVALKKPPKSLKAGKSAILNVKVTPAKATNLGVKFKSSKKSVLTVDKAGKITALKKGKAKVTVTVGKKKYTTLITVK